MKPERAPITKHVEASYDADKGKLRLEWSAAKKEKRQRDLLWLSLLAAVVVFLGLIFIGVTFQGY